MFLFIDIYIFNINLLIGIQYIELLLLIVVKVNFSSRSICNFCCQGCFSFHSFLCVECEEGTEQPCKPAGCCVSAQPCGSGANKQRVGFWCFRALDHTPVQG